MSKIFYSDIADAALKRFNASYFFLTKCTNSNGGSAHFQKTKDD